MNALIKKGTHEVAEVKFSKLLKCDVLLKNGTRTQIAVFLPPEIGFEDINVGLTVGLCHCGDVITKKSLVYTLKNSALKHFCEFQEENIILAKRRKTDPED